jgi:hypothetical protein
MDFIERIFGISPDGGSGSFEILLFLIPMAAVCLLSAVKLVRRSSWAARSMAESFLRNKR